MGTRQHGLGPGISDTRLDRCCRPPRDRTGVRPAADDYSTLEARRERASREREQPEPAVPAPPAVPTRRELEAIRRAEQARALDAEAAEAAAREAAFRTLPLLATVRNSRAHLDGRNARLLARKFGIDGPPETALALMDEFGVNRARVFTVEPRTALRHQGMSP